MKICPCVSSPVSCVSLACHSLFVLASVRKMKRLSEAGRGTWKVNGQQQDIRYHVRGPWEWVWHEGTKLAHETCWNSLMKTSVGCVDSRTLKHLEWWSNRTNNKVVAEGPSFTCCFMTCINLRVQRLISNSLPQEHRPTGPAIDFNVFTFSRDYCYFRQKYCHGNLFSLTSRSTS